MQVTFSTPGAEDIDELVANMRPQDIAEVLAAGHDNLRSVVEDGIRASELCWAIRVDGELAAIAGCAPGGTLTDPCGVPWLLGTALIPKHRRILNRLSRVYIAKMLAAFPRLMNAVHTDNTIAVRWLRQSGFKLEAPVVIDTGATFQVFTMGR